jgi:hypothetical protein
MAVLGGREAAPKLARAKIPGNPREVGRPHGEGDGEGIRDRKALGFAFKMSPAALSWWAGFSWPECSGSSTFSSRKRLGLPERFWSSV